MINPSHSRTATVCALLTVVLSAACSREPPSELRLDRTASTVSRDAGFLTLAVHRVGGAHGAAAVDYSTADESALAGLDYGTAKGTLNWTDGDPDDKVFTVPIIDRQQGAARSFKILLSNASGATLGGTAAAAVTIGAPVPPAVGVQGRYLRDAQGNILRLRGVSVSGLETYAVQGWAWNPDHSAYNPWGNDRPSFAAIRRWHANTVRLPLNEASWLGLTVYSHDGQPRPADPGGNYRAVVQETVREALAAGFYVILDLHWNGPDIRVPGQAAAVPMMPFEGDSAQNPMADADHSIEFWKSVAATFKDQPAVMFELFNEPYFTWHKRRFSFHASWLLEGNDEWAAWQHGTVLTHYRNGVNDAAPTEYAWRTVGMQELLEAVRSTGARNVVLVAGIDWAANLSGWLEHMPQDPIHQISAVWHAYRDPKHPLQPAYGNQQFDYIRKILQADVPVVITETGGPNAAGTEGAPFVASVLHFADAHGMSYLGWSWDAWVSEQNRLIKDAEGTPTDGYGRYYMTHLACVATGTGLCE